jgi:hypothetical protein
MNAAEHLVKVYFETRERCFTLSDVKIPNGNNRQCDLLALRIRDGRPQLLHIETSVTHQLNWGAKRESEVEEFFARKFFGKPGERPEGSSLTDVARGKCYREPIEDLYRAHGVDPGGVIRVACFWYLPAEFDETAILNRVAKRFGLDPRNLRILSLRDHVLEYLLCRSPEAQPEIQTANYQDVVLRTFSLIRQAEIQRKRDDDVPALGNTEPVSGI